MHSETTQARPIAWRVISCRSARRRRGLSHEDQLPGCGAQVPRPACWGVALVRTGAAGKTEGHAAMLTVHIGLMHAIATSVATLVGDDLSSLTI